MNGTGNHQDISAKSVPVPVAAGNAIETFMHTFPATPISSAYEHLAVRHGFVAFPVSVFEGRQCYVFNSFRCFGGRGRAYHNKVQVKFLDNGEIRAVPGGEFAKKAKSP